jgi:HSP20 family molecular chaperone IbpA
MAQTTSETHTSQQKDVARPPRPARDEGGSRALTTPESRADVQLYREFDRALLGLERRFDQTVRDLFGSGRDLLGFPLLQGLSLQTGPDGGLLFQPFGNVQQSLERLEQGWREPLLTWRIAEDGKSVEFRAEVPGVKKGDLDIEVRPDGLVLEGQSDHAKYSAQAKPGVRLDPDSGDARYEDGLLIVTCDVSEPQTPQSKRLTVR